MNILFVVPYPELEPVVQEVYKEYPEKNKVTVEFKVMTVDMVRQYKMEREYDVLVGRNFTLEELKRQYPTKPVINIPITGYDIVQALRGQEDVSLQEGGNCGAVFSYVSI